MFIDLTTPDSSENTKEQLANGRDREIWQILYQCTVIALQEGFWLRLTDPHPDGWETIGVVFRIFGKDDVLNFIVYPHKRQSILYKVDPPRSLWG